MANLNKLQCFINELMGHVCSCCGSGKGFGDFGSNPRESGTCRACGSSNRNRQIAHVIRKSCGIGHDGLLALPEHIHVYNTESTGAVHEAFKAHKHYQCSEYFGPEHVRGSLVNGVRHEDLQALSFSDQTFDLVLSSDVLEHMPWPYVAHAEIFRVLKPGGRHIFTVPYDPSAAQDDCRAELCGTEIRHLKPPQYHGDPVRPDEGVLVWYVFGREMQEHLKHIGFEVETLLLHAPRKGIIGDNAIVFVASKP